jgi:YggT family protein
VNAVLGVVVVLIRLYLFVMIARMIMGLVVAYTQYRPTGAAAVAFEFVYTLTEPPLRFLRRFIPPLRLGNMAFDLGFLILFIVLQILAGQLNEIAGG